MKKISDEEIKYAAIMSVYAAKKFFDKEIKNCRQVIGELTKRFSCSMKKNQILQSQNKHENFVIDVADNIKKYTSDEFGIAVFIVNLFFKQLSLCFNALEKGMLAAPLNEDEISKITKAMVGKNNQLKSIVKITDLKSDYLYRNFIKEARKKAGNSSLFDWELKEWNRGK